MLALRLALALSALLALPAGAQAAVSVSRGLNVTVTGDEAANVITVGFNTGGGEVVVTATGVTATFPCTASGNTARCPAALAQGVDVSGGDGGDSVTFAPSLNSSELGSLTASGDAGDDRLDNNSTRPITLRGGAGADAFSGGTGDPAVREAVEYGDHTGPVRAANDGSGSGTACPGSACEGDTIDALIDTIVGGPGGDTLVGGAGRDTLEGAGGADLLEGGAAVDLLAGGAGADVLDAGSSKESDVLDGGSEAPLPPGVEDDTVTYARRATGVRVDLTATGATQGEGCGTAAGCENDTITNVENVVGTVGDDRLTGSADDNRITALAGADTVDAGDGDDAVAPGEGKDTVAGAAGTDTVTYSDRSSAAAVNLTAETGPEGDAVTAFENATGGGGPDTVTGSSGANALVGGGGPDSISALAGDDTIDAVDGVADDVSCGAGSDTARADDIDVVGSDCETVTRVATPRPAPAGGGGGTTTPPPATGPSSRPPSAAPAARSRVTISDASVTEGRRGKLSPITFSVALDVPQDSPVRAAWRTEPSRARAGSDFRAAGGTITFAPGQTTQKITVLVRGDSRREPTERFYVRVTGLTGNARFARSRGVGSILDDDRERRRSPTLSLTVSPRRDLTAPYVYTMRVKVSRPKGMPVSACARGRFSVVVVDEGRVVARGVDRLSRTCTYRARPVFRKARGTVRFRARFLGTKRLAPFGPAEVLVQLGRG